MAIPILFTTSGSQGEDDLVLFPERPGRGIEDASFFGSREEGQLAIDVMETATEVILRSAIAAVRPEDLEVFVNNDMLTVRGTRTKASEEQDGDYLVRECHWGAFSRSVILPAEIDADRISAELKNGILTVRMPKTHRSRKIAVKRA
jgi:HSP20 family protein